MTLHSNPTSNKIYWENCDVTAWPFVPWECAKLYMPRCQPPTNIGPSHSDAQALLTLMASCTFFHGKLSPAGLTLIHMVSKVRNSVMHSGEMKLSDGDRKSFIQDIIHLLEDPTHLISLKECKQAVDEINKINDDSLDVFFNIDLEMKALRDCVNDCRQEIGVHKEDIEVTVEYLKVEFTKLKVEFDNIAKETKDKVEDLDAKCQQIDTSVTLLSKTVSCNQEIVKLELSKHDKEILEVRASSSEAKDQFVNLTKETNDKYGDLDAKWQQTDTSVTIVSSSVENVKQQLSKHDKEIQEIQASSSEAKDMFVNHAKETKDRFGNLDAKCQQTDTSVTILSKTVSSGQESLQQELSRLDKEIQEVKASSSEAMKVADRVSAENMESDISKLQDDLIKAYINLRCIQVSPIYEKVRCNIDNIYVDLVIAKKQDSRRIDEESRNIKEECKHVSTQSDDAQSSSRKVLKVTSYKQIFQDERGSNFKRVYLRGKGGLGKTTFCRKVLHAWCSAHEGKGVAQDGSFQDEAVLKMFDLLFYINLREVSVDEKTLIAVIHAQFPLEEVPSKSVLETLFRCNGNKILFILDGLDEMKNAGFIDSVVTRRVYPNCSFLVSSRPYKISQMELHEETEIDLLLDLKGFSPENAVKCAEKIFENCYKDGNAIKQFKKDIAESRLATQLTHVPLLLLFLAHVWYENNRSLPRKLHELYIMFLNLLSDRMKEKYKKDPNHRQTRFTLDDTPSPLPSKIYKTSLVVIYGEGFLYSLCKVAHQFLLGSEKENYLVFEETKLMKVFGDKGKEKLDVALNLGILSVTDSVSFLKRKTCVSFIHKSMQEFFTAVCFIYSPNKLANFISSISSINDVQKNENVIVFLVGLVPDLGNRVLEKVNELCRDEYKKLRSGDEMSMEVLKSSVYLRCKQEVLGENVLLNVACLCLEEDFDLQSWNPTILEMLYLRSYTFTDVLVDLRGLRGLRYLVLHDLNYELYLPEFGSLIVLIVKCVTLSSRCDVLGRTLAHCTKLERLGIHKTQLHNCLLDLSNMTELMILDMLEVTMSSSCCDVLGRTLKHCTNLKNLKIHNTDLHNCLLDLTDMMGLTYLDMSEVTLSSSCCDVLGRTLTHCMNIKRLRIHKTHLHNCLLDLSNMTELMILDISEITLSSSGCDVLGRTLTHCTKLERISIHKTHLHNCLLDLSNMTELMFLDISDVTLSSGIYDVSGSTLVHCTKLERMSIHNTHLHNCLLDLSNMTELMILDISDVTLSSGIYDVSGSTLAHCTKLERISIHNTHLHNCLLDLSNMTELMILDISDVTMSRGCCDALGKTLIHCTKLKSLRIHKTQLHNCLLDLSNMTELASLNISDVTMSRGCCDVLGKTLMHCTKLKSLRIHKTQLHNCLLDLSNMTDLMSLDMSYVTLSSYCCDVLGRTLKHCYNLINLCVCYTDLHNGILDISKMTRLVILKLDGVKMSKDVWLALKNPWYEGYVIPLPNGEFKVGLLSFAPRVDNPY